MLSGTSDCATVGGGGATVAAVAGFAGRFFVVFFAAFFVVFLAAFLVVFLAAFLVLFEAFFVLLPPFFVDFFAAFTGFFAPLRDFDFDALFFVPLPPPLRAPLDFLVPFLAAIAFAPFKFLSFAQRSKINCDCLRRFSSSCYKRTTKDASKISQLKNTTCVDTTRCFGYIKLALHTTRGLA
jgi:hypothetical protein